MKQRLIIYGAGNLGLYLRYLGEEIIGHDVIGFVDSFKTEATTGRVLGRPDELENIFRDHAATGIVYGIGYHNFELRASHFEYLRSLQLPIVGLIHPTAIVDPSCRLGMGTHVFAGCVVDRNVVLEDNVLLNVGCAIAHDSIVRQNSFLSPRVCVAGFCDIGENSFVGLGSLILDNIHVRGGNVIGAGSLVTHNITDTGGLYFGSPASFQKALVAPDGSPYSGRTAHS